MLKRLFCEHEYVFVRRLNAVDCYWSIWKCRKCSKNVSLISPYDERKHEGEVD